MSEHLRDGGHNVVLLVFREGGGSPRTDLRMDPGGSLTVMPWPTDAPTRLADGTFFMRLLRSVRPDCVVGQMETTNWTMVLSWLSRVPVRVAWYHMLMRAVVIDGARRSLPLRVRRRAMVYRCATNLASVSRAGVDDLVEQYGVDRDRCVVVPNGLSAPPLQGRDCGHLPSDAEGIRMVSVGRLVPTKDHATLIRAIAELSAVRLDCVITIVGDGPQRSKLEALVDTLGLRDVVRFSGAVDHERTIDLMREANVYVHSALSDNNPLAIIEAMSLGLPIVTTAVGGVPEMIAHDREGLLIPPADPFAMSTALSELFADGARRRRIGEAARQRFLDEFEVSHWVERTSRFLLGEVERAS